VRLRLRQNGGASRVQYSRSLASSVAVGRLPVDRRPIPVMVIEPASTSSGAFNSFSKNFVLCVYLFFLRCLISQSTTTFPFSDAFYFSFLLFSWCSPSWTLASATVVPLPFYFYFFLITVILLFTVFVLVCPGADKLNIYTFGMKQALCATTARLRVPCRVLSWPPILCAKSGRICKTSTALNDWEARASSNVPMCGNFLQTVGVLGLKKTLSFS
jgi:hypothetical protein